MRRKVAWSAVFVVCLLSCRTGILAAGNGDRLPVVKVQSGWLEGARFGPQADSAAFLGVPYAAPPVGELRWKPPQAAPKWNGTHSAVQYGSPCAQLPARWFPYIAGNEDCLYLNVWTTALRPGASLPVLVYFHGGSNTQGYSQMMPVGPTLSPMGLVVVSANYRLGPFGFLAHPVLTAESDHHSSGNYGLLDQQHALRWVKENIREFGGDPTRVTVIGQSAGAVDICLLMASPLAHGLLNRAILESGECQDTLNEDIRQPIHYNFIDTTGEASGERLAKNLGIGENADTLRQLRRASTDDILKAWKNDPGLHFDAIVDGWIIPRQPAQIFAGGKQLPVPILVGSNADEATVFGHNDVKTVADYKAQLQQDAGEYASQELQLFPVGSDSNVAERSVQLESDRFACAAYSIAHAMSKAGVTSYLYYFTYVDPGKRSRLGAHHGEELFFLTNEFPDDWQHTGRDEELGRLIRGYWVQFAKTGDPNFESAPRWPSYDPESRQYFELGNRLELHNVAERVRGLESVMQSIVAH
jgi:para-nitrobenzyl esterase